MSVVLLLFLVHLTVLAGVLHTKRSSVFCFKIRLSFFECFLSWSMHYQLVFRTLLPKCLILEKSTLKCVCMYVCLYVCLYVWFFYCMLCVCFVFLIIFILVNNFLFFTLSFLNFVFHLALCVCYLFFVYVCLYVCSYV